MATLSASTKSQWDSLTKEFGAGHWFQPVGQLPLLKSLVKQATKRKPWKGLDVGCGLGHNTRLMLQAGASYVLAFDVSNNMVEEAKLETDKFFHTHALAESRANFVVASATEISSIPGAQEGTFDLAMCIYVLCNLLTKEEVKRALEEMYKMLKPGGKLLIYETHVIEYIQWNDKSRTPNLFKWGVAKEDGTQWGYFEDEGKPREIMIRMGSGQVIKFINRLYTLSTWVSWIVEAGFQITQFLESHVDPQAIPADAPDNEKFIAGKPVDMCWECTKPLPL